MVFEISRTFGSKSCYAEDAEEARGERWETKQVFWVSLRSRRYSAYSAIKALGSKSCYAEDAWKPNKLFKLLVECDKTC